MTRDDRWASASERLVILQYGGDYREAYERLSRGGQENYYAQRYSVDAVAAWGRARPVATVCCLTSRAYDEVLANGVRAIGANLAAPPAPRALLAILDRLRPTWLVLRTPIPALVSWACDRGVRTVMTLAESLPDTPGRREQVQLMNDPTVEWVGCYQRSSIPEYVHLGIDPAKLVPWRWPASWNPADLAPKRLDGVPTQARLLFVGALREEKGLSDALAAVAQLQESGQQVRLRVVGEGEHRHFRALAAQLGVQEKVEFQGGVEASAVLSLMRSSDVVLIPTRTSFPEALPLVLEHSFCARTPAVVSAHPAFARCLEHRTDSMLFPPGDAPALAACVRELLDDPALYERISSAAPATWARLQAPLLWDELIEAWLADTRERLSWLQARAAAASSLRDSPGAVASGHH